MINNFFKLTLPILILLSFFSCGINISGGDGEVITSNNINNQTKSEIHQLAKGIYEDVLQHDIRYTATLFPPSSKSLVDTLNNIIGNIYVTGSADRLNTVGEFHIVNNDQKKINSVSSEIRNNKYTYFFTPYTPETYVYLFYVPGKYDSTNVLISLEFSKEKKKWWLTNIAFGLLTYKNQFAPQNVYVAFNQYLKNDIVPAAYNMAITMQLLLPATNKFHYETEKEIMRLLNDIHKEYTEKFAFPLIVNCIESNPEVQILQSASSPGAPHAMIVYRSHLFAEGERALLDENNEMHLMRNILFPGILKYGDSVTYKVISDTTANAMVKIFQRNNGDKHMTSTEYNSKYVYPLLPDSIVQKMKEFEEYDVLQ